MGDIYSIHTIIRRSDSDRLISGLSILLDKESQERLEGRVWSPRTETKRLSATGSLETDASGFSGVELDDLERKLEGVLRVCLAVNLEPASRRHAEPGMADESYRRAFESGQLYPISVSLSVCAGARYLDLDVSVDTRSLRSIFVESSALHELWREFSRRINAIVSYVDIGLEDYDDAAIRIYPTSGRLSLPHDEDCPDFADIRFDYPIDPYVEWILRNNPLFPRTSP